MENIKLTKEELNTAFQRFHKDEEELNPELIIINRMFNMYGTKLLLKDYNELYTFLYDFKQGMYERIRTESIELEEVLEKLPVLTELYFDSFILTLHHKIYGLIFRNAYKFDDDRTKHLYKSLSDVVEVYIEKSTGGVN